MKPILLCADDYAYNEAVSEGILSLLKQERLNATSCMTTRPSWPTAAKALRTLPAHIQIGLHINLTEEHPAIPLKQLMKDSFFKKVDASSLWERIQRQFHAFSEHMGRLPDFIDGHQHVHQLPIVRQLILRTYQTRIVNTDCFVRLPGNPFIESWRLPFIMKQWAIQGVGYTALKRLLKKNNIPYNHSFAGVYDFQQAKDYPHYFQRFLSYIKPHGLIMCHPGLPQSKTEDPIANARSLEYAYFSSKAFLEDCAKYTIHLSKTYYA